MRTGRWLRTTVVSGSLIAVGSLYPLSAMAQQTPADPSGANVAVGGVSLSRPGAQNAVGGQSLVLPNTGGAQADDPVQQAQGVIAIVAGLVVLVGTGAYLRQRATQRRIGG